MLVLHGSSRENGNTKQLANIVIEGIEAEEIDLREKKITPIHDMRHDPDGFSIVEDDYYEMAEKMLDHDRVLIVNPVYWYGMTGPVKLFIDRWSESMRDPTVNFKERMADKKMYVLVVGGDNPKIKALPLITQFEYTFNFVGAKLDRYIIGEANQPGDIMNDKEAIQAAKMLNERFKQ